MPSPEDDFTSSSESSTSVLLGLALLHFWPRVLEGAQMDEGADSSSEGKSDLPGMLFPPTVPDLITLCEGSSAMAAFSVSLNLADGTVAHLVNCWVCSQSSFGGSGCYACE